MADGRQNNLVLGIIVGGLLVAVAVLGYLLLGGETPNNKNEITIELPKLQIDGNN